MPRPAFASRKPRAPAQRCPPTARRARLGDVRSTETGRSTSKQNCNRSSRLFIIKGMYEYTSCLRGEAELPVDDDFS